MARSIDTSFYKSRAWKECRKAYIAKCGGLCERCLSKGIYKPGKIVHHKIHLNDDNISNPDIALSFENLEYLCFDCHQREHFQRDRRYKINSNGDVFIDDAD